MNHRRLAEDMVACCPRCKQPLVFVKQPKENDLIGCSGCGVSIKLVNVEKAIPLRLEVLSYSKAREEKGS